jgi:hypothetical protein
LKFRGTSVLFRLNKSINELIQFTDANNQKNNCDLSEIEMDIDLKYANNNSNDNNYDLATHTVKVKRTGVLADITAFWDLDGIII